MTSTAITDPLLHWLSSEQNVALLVLDGHHTIVGANLPAQELLGRSESELRGTGLHGLGLESDARLQALLQGPQGPSPYSCQLPIKTSDGQQHGVIATAFRTDNQSCLLKLVPIGANEAAMARIKEDEERYRLALDAAGIGTWDMNIKKNATRRSLLHDQCFGYQTLQEHWGYDTFLSHVIGLDRARVDNAYRDAMKGGKEYDLRFRVRWPDGSIHWLWSKGQFYLDEHGNPERVAGIQADVTEEVNLREELRYQATHDHLTRLRNRASFEASLKGMLKRSEATVAVILIDIDHFKRFNDAFNHMGGDEVLKALANRIEATALPGMISARFGGDEFVIAAPDAETDPHFLDWIHRLHLALSEKLPLGQSWVQPTVSMGIAFSPAHGTGAMDLLRAADTAMYDAKRCGRATYRIFDPLHRVAELNTLLLADRIPEALAVGEIQMYYQPQFAIADRRLIGMEALLRWMPRGEAPIPPNQLIHAAEQSGFIVELGDWVIHEACRQIREWRDKGLETVPVAINVSGVQFLRGEFAQIITKHLEQFQLPGRSLEIEITETIALDNSDNILCELHKLRQAGLGVAIDDFGTGFSSLSYLRHFPINRIKIDRSFVSGCLDIRENAAICKTIISLAHNLGCQVIAEGVETSDQLDFLLQQGCEEVQGYLLAKPMPAEAASAWLNFAGQDPVKPDPKTPVPSEETEPEELDSTVSYQGDELVRLRTVTDVKTKALRRKDKLHRLVEMAARAVDVPMAALNLVEHDKVTTLIPFGLEPTEFQRSTAFCHHTIRQIDILEITDTQTHAFFQHSPAVIGPPGIRFYAGLGIMAANHQMIGTLCLLDQNPRELQSHERDMLISLGAMVESELAHEVSGFSSRLFTPKSRRAFNAYLRDSWRLASQNDTELAVVLVGIDKLKEINDSGGVDQGDQCLAQVMDAMSDFADKHIGVEAFRLEGDKIALLCRNTSLAHAQTLVAELKATFNSSSHTEDHRTDATFTATCAVHSSSSNGTVASMDQFLANTRQALQSAKTSDAGRIRLLLPNAAH